MTSTPRRRRRWPLALAGFALICAAGTVGALALTNSSAAGSSHSQLLDLRGDPVATEQADKAAEIPHATTDTGIRLAIPSVGLDVEVDEIATTSPTVEPPGFTAAYHLTNLGTAVSTPDNGAIFLVTHSIRGGGLAPGNYLIDIPRQTSALQAGTSITLGDHTYTVTGSHIVPKPQLAADAATWENQPGRLVIITCLQNPRNTPSENNLVLEAQLTH
ncbi:hypothetical protein [Leifsonia sp. fls2-241-R2A-40a]|uniref:class F sortase n=1 Tax=Leifsonia sp. fls2-241-R2A-40a TaxID=3040290 RepID=UPI00254ABEDD|nr:hypothetical protein [Leifsonia sp. fls2-241-R2A-40a]